MSRVRDGCVCSFPAGACIDTYCRCYHHGYPAPQPDTRRCPHPGCTLNVVHFGDHVTLAPQPDTDAALTPQEWAYIANCIPWERGDLREKVRAGVTLDQPVRGAWPANQDRLAAIVCDILPTIPANAGPAAIAALIAHGLDFAGVTLDPQPDTASHPILIALGQALAAIGYTEVRDTITEPNATGWTLRGDTASRGLREAARALLISVDDYIWLVSPRDDTGTCRLCGVPEGVFHDDAKECGALSAARDALRAALATEPQP